MTLKDYKDLDNFSMKISMIKLECNKLLTKDDTIATLLEVTGDKYAAKIHDEKKLTKRRKKKVTFGALLEAMYEVWQMTRENSKAGMNNDKTTLGSVQSVAFTGKC